MPGVTNGPKTSGYIPLQKIGKNSYRSPIGTSWGIKQVKGFQSASRLNQEMGIGNVSLPSIGMKKLPKGTLPKIK